MLSKDDHERRYNTNCRDFEHHYMIQDGTCLLSHVTGSDAGGLYTPDGVHVHYFEMKPSLDCGGVMTGDRGTIASPGWPRHYSHHLNCSWTLVVADFKVIRMEIYHLDLGHQTDNRCDTRNDILAFTEQTEQGRILRCADNFLTEFTSLTNHLQVTFTTNAQNDAPGFRLFYNSDWPCEATYTKDNGEFASPRWPNAYQAMTSCRWLIRAPPLSQIYLRFTTAHLESHRGSSCRTAYDTVTLYDGNSTSAATLHTFCGDSRPLSFTSTGNAFYVEFISDSRVQSKGFHAAYTFLHYTTTSTSTSTASSVKTQTHATVTHKDSNAENVSVSGWSTEEQNYTSNASFSANIALHRIQDETVALVATFVEPVWDATVNNVSAGDHGVTGDDIGMGLRPGMTNRADNAGREIRALIMGILVSFLVMFLVVLISLFVVCRYYRRRLPKRRHGNNMADNYGEENESLCEEHPESGQRQFTDEDDLDDAARLPLPGCPDPPSDMEFHNPIYNRKHGTAKRKKIDHVRLAEFEQIDDTADVMEIADCSLSVTETPDTPLSVLTVETLLISEC